jgi:hypothetical protein
MLGKSCQTVLRLVRGSISLFFFWFFFFVDAYTPTVIFGMEYQARVGNHRIYMYLNTLTRCFLKKPIGSR